MLHKVTRASRGTVVIKYGGNAMDTQADQALALDVAELRAHGYDVVVVHGGGPEIDAALSSRNIVTERIDGLRVTTRAALEVTEAVLCGVANKRLVRALIEQGVPAVGISGQDGAMLRAQQARSRQGADLGYVGEIVGVTTELLVTLLESAFVPVVAPLAIGDCEPQAYNVNADSAAAAIAGALKAHAFVTLTNVERLLADVYDRSSAIDRLTADQAQAFAASPACLGGMQPKVRAAIDAVRAGVSGAYIRAAGPRAVMLALAGDATIISR